MHLVQLHVQPLGEVDHRAGAGRGGVGGLLCGLGVIDLVEERQLFLRRLRLREFAAQVALEQFGESVAALPRADEVRRQSDIHRDPAET